MTALLSAWKTRTKVAFYVADCRSMDIEVLPPDINTSGYDFTIEDCPGQPALSVLEWGRLRMLVRRRFDPRGAQGGSFYDLNDLARRADLQKVGKRALSAWCASARWTAWDHASDLQG